MFFSKTYKCNKIIVMPQLARCLYQCVVVAAADRSRGRCAEGGGARATPQLPSPGDVPATARPLRAPDIRYTNTHAAYTHTRAHIY